MEIDCKKFRHHFSNFNVTHKLLLHNMADQTTGIAGSDGTVWGTTGVRFAGKMRRYYAGRGRGIACSSNRAGRAGGGHRS